MSLSRSRRVSPKRRRGRSARVAWATAGCRGRGGAGGGCGRLGCGSRGSSSPGNRWGLAGRAGAQAGFPPFGFEDFAAGNCLRQAASERFGALLGVAERFGEGDVFTAEANGAAERTEWLAGGHGPAPEARPAPHRDGRTCADCGPPGTQPSRGRGGEKIREVGDSHRHEEPGSAGRQGREPERREQAVGGFTEGEKNPVADAPAQAGALLTSVKPATAQECARTAPGDGECASRRRGERRCPRL